jgi:hypothetical protein
MGKRTATNRREQTVKGRDVSRVNRVLDIRRSNASGPMPSGARYDRSKVRNAMQAGRFDFED